jgi:micrococcal nuclease
MKWLYAILLCWTVSALPDRVIDGDTFIARVALWPSSVASEPVQLVERIRVLGVNTPEKGKPGYAEALAFTAEWLKKGDVRITTCTRDAFGRILARVTRQDKVLADDLIAAGHHGR